MAITNIKGDTKKAKKKIRKSQAMMLYNALIADGEQMMREFGNTINTMPFWRRIPVAWRVILGRL